ncbi:Daunorubicin/doxorubicin resistance ATP-binding protein DrrA [Nocardia africana]|uniref:Daunorubicin/doxorubicin resistance ATP-binding protein DrrA n=1 Tax=Nocardia africana TaxID=134964 RepID=A0A378X3P8_9NOCA|nr:Daunorubicin/doxorubicin resistance ATP-binding protein DrrA [Nocardia africana]
MNSTAIAASGLRKAYGDKTILDGIDLTIEAGTIFSLLGPNGAGKTTTVNVLTTLAKADGGPLGSPATTSPPRVRPSGRRSG